MQHLRLNRTGNGAYVKRNDWDGSNLLFRYLNIILHRVNAAQSSKSAHYLTERFAHRWFYLESRKGGLSTFGVERRRIVGFTRNHLVTAAFFDLYSKLDNWWSGGFRIMGDNASKKCLFSLISRMFYGLSHEPPKNSTGAITFRSGWR